MRYSYHVCVWVSENESLDEMTHSLAEARKLMRQLIQKAGYSYIDAYIRKYDEIVGMDVCDYDFRGRIRIKYV